MKYKTPIQMKRVIVLILCINFLLSCKKESEALLPPNTYEINGTVKGVYNGVRAYIKEIVNGRERIVDTAIIVNESFAFKGFASHSSLQVLTINSVYGNLPFVLEPGRTSIEVYKDSIYYSNVIGTPNNNAFSNYKEEIRKRNTDLSKIRIEMNASRNRSNGEFNTLYEKSVAATEALNNYPFEFIETYSNLDISLFVLESTLSSNNSDFEKFKQSRTLLTDVINRNSHNKNIDNRLSVFVQQKENEANVALGKPAPNFSGTTPEGKTISLNDIKGKATIIDFWAAWCAPCRRENPNVVKVYEKYHDKGLEIISVGLDGRAGQNNPKADWLKAIKDDELNWHHISSLNYFNEPAVRLYAVNAIPATFILDENGIIVSKRLRGQALENKIAELLN